MRKISILGFFIAFSCLLLAASQARADAIRLKAQGSARGPISMPEAVKERAIDGALSSAVREAVRIVVRAEGIRPDESKLDAAIYSRSRNFVSNFTITVEEFKPDPPPPEPVEGADAATVPPAPPQAGQPPTPSPQAAAPLVEELGTYTLTVEASVDSAGLKAALAAALSAAPRPVSIVILDARDWDAYKALVASLGKVVALKEIEPASFYGRRVVLRANTTAEARLLAERVGRELGIEYVAFASSDDEIVIKTVPHAVREALK